MRESSCTHTAGQQAVRIWSPGAYSAAIDANRNKSRLVVAPLRRRANLSTTYVHKFHTFRCYLELYNTVVWIPIGSFPWPNVSVDAGLLPS